MIYHDLKYYQPETMEEAIRAWNEAQTEGLKPRYLSGGTEVVTLARDGKQTPGALIDLKRIPETHGISAVDGSVRYGSSIPLTTLSDEPERSRFPLLAHAAGAVADRTIRNSITLGGNIAGMLPYREAVLPFILFEAIFEFVTSDGSDGVSVNRVAAAEAFKSRLLVPEGGFLSAVLIPAAALDAPWAYRRRTRDARVDYPLVTVCGGRVGDTVRLAVSGAFNGPVTGTVADGRTLEDRLVATLESFTMKYRNDMRGSAEYRRSLLTLLATEIVEEMES